MARSPSSKTSSLKTCMSGKCCHEILGRCGNRGTPDCGRALIDRERPFGRVMCRYAGGVLTAPGGSVALGKIPQSIEVGHHRRTFSLPDLNPQTKKLARTHVRESAHGGFDFVSSVGDAGSQNFCSGGGDQKHVFEVETLAVDLGDGFEVDCCSGFAGGRRGLLRRDSWRGVPSRECFCDRTMYRWRAGPLRISRPRDGFVVRRARHSNT